MKVVSAASESHMLSDHSTVNQSEIIKDNWLVEQMAVYIYVTFTHFEAHWGALETPGELPINYGITGNQTEIQQLGALWLWSHLIYRYNVISSLLIHVKYVITGLLSGFSCFTWSGVIHNFTTLWDYDAQNPGLCYTLSLSAHSIEL